MNGITISIYIARLCVRSCVCVCVPPSNSKPDRARNVWKWKWNNGSIEPWTSGLASQHYTIWAKWTKAILQTSDTEFRRFLLLLGGADWPRPSDYNLIWSAGATRDSINTFWPWPYETKFKIWPWLKQDCSFQLRAERSIVALLSQSLFISSFTD